MYRRFRKTVSLFLLPLFLLLSACSVPEARNAASARPRSTVSFELLSSAPLTPVSGEMVEENFHPLKKNVSATLYCDLKAQPDSRTICGSYDFDSDGKNDGVTLKFHSAPDTGRKSVLTVGSASVSLELTEAAGVYAVEPDGSGPKLALVDYGMDNDVTTSFFSYDGKKLTQIGRTAGGIEPDSRDGYNIPAYNFQILSDGNGRLIPRFGIMLYVTPNVFLSAVRMEGGKLVPIDLPKTENRSCTLAMNIGPYFEQGSADVSNPELRCDDRDRINLEKGRKITLLSVNPSPAEMACAGVRLSDGKEGLLYFYLHP